MKLSLLLLLLLSLASCARTQKDPFAGEPGAPVWPPPPEAPRVEYVTSLREQTDLFTSGGFLSAVVGFAAGEAETVMVRPHAIAIHPEGGLLVTDPGLACVHFYDTARRKYRRLGTDIEGGLPSPVGVAVAADGSILVSDSRRAGIEQFTRNGKHIGSFGNCTFKRPGGMAVSDSGEVFVADVTAHSIIVLSPAGALLRTLGANGSDPGMFNFPSHVSLDAEGNLLVTDSMNFRIQRLNTDGQVIAVYGEASNARGDFARPKGVAHLGADTFAAIEGLYDSLVFFNAEGELLLVVGGPGSEPGEFWLPNGLAVDRARNLLFIADSYNSRIQVFRMISP